MKIAGIIAEYNPFHTGHAYHIAKTREKCGADHIICVISGNFTQRGEPAIYDKWARARAALENGADLVLELPFCYAVQSAEGFAQGGIGVLDALSCIDFLSFGAENDDVDTMRRIAETLINEPADFHATLKCALLKGLSYPAARANALTALLPNAQDALWACPNNILGIEYIKALIKTGSRIEPSAVKRQGGGYASASLHERFSSAKAIRSAIRKGNMEYLRFLPKYDAAAYGEPVFPEMMFPFLIFRLRSMQLFEIEKIEGVCEGLEYKIADAAKTSQSYHELIGKIKSKRFTYTRIQRVLLYCLFGLTKDKMASLREERLYARVLGVRRECLPLLSLLSKRSTIRLVTKASEFLENPLFEADLFATDIYSLFTKKIAPGGRDFTTQFPII